MTKYIQCRLEETVLEVKINRPEKKNALTLEMYSSLVDALDQAKKDENIRVFFLRGEKRCFTSGNDIQEFLENPPQDDSSPILIFLKKIANFPKPIVVAVDGLAVGVGATMLLHCDLVYASQGSRFSFPFINIATCPEAGSSFLLPYMVGHHRASELLMLGDFFSAQKAYEYGLVNQVFSKEEIYEKARAKALELAKKPPKAMQMTKKLLKKPWQEKINQVIEEEGKEFISLLKQPEAKEAFLAFMEKRAPNFSKKISHS